MATQSNKGRENTRRKNAIYLSPCWSGFLTFLAFILYIIFTDYVQDCQAEFAVQTISVSPFSATWHVDFLVKNPSSRYSIYYADHDAALRLGPLNAAVLNTTHRRMSSSHTYFSVDFVPEGNASDVVFEQLEIKLRAMHNSHLTEYNECGQSGHLDVKCHNLSLNHEDFEKINCHSSFTPLKTVGRE